MYCGNCGAKLDGDERLCSACDKAMKENFINPPKAEPGFCVAESTVVKPKVNTCFIFVLAATIVMILVMMITDMFEFKCDFKTYGEAETDSFIVSVIGGNEDLRRHESSKALEDILPEINTTIGVMFAVVVAILVAVCLLSYYGKHGISMLLLFVCLGVLISAGMILQVCWAGMCVDAGVGFSCTTHSVLGTIGYDVILVSIISSIFMIMVKS